MEELNIEKFDPTVDELNKLVSVSKKVVITDINDKAQLETVRENRITLKNARVAITKKGKELRDDAIKFQKAVIAKEKELVAIIEPEEDRLKAIEEEAKELKLKEERKALLPERKEQLAKIGDSVKIKDEELLEMDTETFISYKNDRTAAKNEADRLALEEKERAIKEEAERQEREKETREREAQARKEAEEEAQRRLENEKREHELQIQREKEDAERRVKEERERMEREQKEKEEREAREKAEAEAAKKAEQEKLEKQKKYQTWLTKNGYNETEFKIIDQGTQIALYKLVDTFKK